MARMNSEVSSTESQPRIKRFRAYGDLICNALMADATTDRSLLHEAAVLGRLLTLRTLIVQGCSVNTLTIDRVSALHDACAGGHFACAKLLLENGADIHCLTLDGASPLFNACISGNSSCVRLLLEHGASPHVAPMGSSPLHEAAKRGHVECMELLLAKGANIDQEVPQMGTPLYTACLFKKPDCMEKLLHLGADVHGGKGEEQALHVAAQNDSVQAVVLLMDYGASVWSKNTEGRRPVELAPADGSVKRELQLRDGPSTLMQLCRLHIRRCLGRARFDKTASLSLPYQLCDYLCYR